MIRRLRLVPAGILMLMVFTLSGCDGDGADSDSPATTLSGSQQVIPQGAIWQKETIFRPNPPRQPATPRDFNATIGTAHAATLSKNQPTTEPALIVIDYMRLIEVGPTGSEKTVDEQSYNNVEPRPLMCVPSGPCEGGLYPRSPFWYATDDHTAVFNSEIKDGSLTIDVAKTSNNIVHWWTRRVPNIPTAKYVVEMRLKISGKVALQVGSIC